MTSFCKERCSAFELDQARFALAVRTVVGPSSPRPGVDCVLYAFVGAAVLRSFGFAAVAQAGSAIWRVGPGSGDVITHAEEAAGALYVIAAAPGPVALMHAWIRVDEPAGQPRVVDLTTWQLAKKARELDAADGGHTLVRFCPDFLWVAESEATRLTPAEVAKRYDVGVFAYHAKPAMTALALPDSLAGELRSLIGATELCYHMLAEGNLVQVLSVDESGCHAADENAALNLVRTTGPSLH